MQRRDFIKRLPLGLGLAAAIPLLRGSAFAIQPNKMLNALTNPFLESDRVMVLIYLRGGNDGLNTLIPFANPTYDRVRPNTGFITKDEKARLTRKLSDTLAFNPYMERFADLWDDGKVAILQNVGMAVPTLSHFHAADLWNHGCDIDQLLSTGWVGRWMESVYPDYPNEKPTDPIAIAMGNATSDLFQGTRNSVEVLVKDPNHYSPFGIDPGGVVPNTLGGDELTYVRELMTISDHYAKRFSSLFPKSAKNLVEYPQSAFAQNLKQIAWCISSGMQTKLYFVQLDGFDTHYFQSSKDDIASSHALLLRQLSEGLFAFQKDLEAFGLDKRVVTTTYSEFGRRVSENGGFSSGTDHGTTAPHFVIGSQVNAGLYGPDPNLDDLDANGDPFIDFEFRQMYASMMGDWFGVSTETCTTILSPGHDREPFDTQFELNDGSAKRSLIKKSVVNSVAEMERDRSFRLRGNYPNPANAHTRIMFELAKPANVKLQLFDVKGTLVSTLINTRLGSGEHAPEVRTAELAAGSYIYRLSVDDQFETKRLNIVH